MKYFFLSEGWTVGRVWANGGLWQVAAWRRQPDIQRINICLLENSEVFWLYRVEEEIMTVEVKPMPQLQIDTTNRGIGQVVIKRLMTAEQVLERLGTAEAKCQLENIQLVTV
ncbi:MAG: hypothetical protein KME64_35705 [Scytonematopsis contorta HA4267-MV1]|jgi:hypothetical protein|nr:hypothetical protein [Scytonematopsis contorta HA4267-MV1]